MLSECPTFLDVVLDVDGGVAAGDSERRWRSQVLALSAAHHGVSLLQAGGAVSLGAPYHGVSLLQAGVAVSLGALHHGVPLLQAGGSVSLGALHHGVPLLLMVFVGVFHRRLYTVPISSHVAARIIVVVIYWVLHQHNELVRT